MSLFPPPAVALSLSLHLHPFSYIPPSSRFIHHHQSVNLDLLRHMWLPLSCESGTSCSHGRRYSIPDCSLPCDHVSGMFLGRKFHITCLTGHEDSIGLIVQLCIIKKKVKNPKHTLIANLKFDPPPPSNLPTFLHRRSQTVLS